MTDINMNILNTPTLGEAANGDFLDVVQAQIRENKAAVIEDRDPLTAVPKPKWPRTVLTSTESDYKDYDFE